MKKEISGAAFAVIIVVALAAVVGLWFWQPWKPKVYGLEPPSQVDRAKQAQQMRNDMAEAMKARQRAGGGGQ